jgi:hypothetical protein
LQATQKELMGEAAFIVIVPWLVFFKRLETFEHVEWLELLVGASD